MSEAWQIREAGWYAVKVGEIVEGGDDDCYLGWQIMLFDRSLSTGPEDMLMWRSIEGGWFSDVEFEEICPMLMPKGGPPPSTPAPSAAIRKLDTPKRRKLDLGK